MKKEKLLLLSASLGLLIGALALIWGADAAFWMKASSKAVLSIALIASARLIYMSSN